MNTRRNHSGSRHSWKKKKSPGPLIKVFHQTAATHERFFHPTDARCVFFITHSWTLKPRLLMKNFPWTLMKAGRVQCRFNFMFPNTFQERVLLEQVNRTYSHSSNKLPENYSLSVHCPLMNQLWATHEFLFFEPAIQKDSKTIDIGRISDLLIFGACGNRSGHPLMIYSCVAHESFMKHPWT